MTRSYTISLQIKKWRRESNKIMVSFMVDPHPYATAMLPPRPPQVNPKSKIHAKKYLQRTYEQFIDILKEHTKGEKV